MRRSTEKCELINMYSELNIPSKLTKDREFSLIVR